jgi:hypothetical protein
MEHGPSDSLKVLRNFFKGRFHTIGEINRKYSKPRIHQSRMVRTSLLMLRLYLLLMVAILLYKFITLIK